MKRIVIRNLSEDLQQLISARMKEEGCGAGKAVVEILRDAAIERMVEHDIAILSEHWKDDPAPSTVSSGCCARVHITIQCGSAEHARNDAGECASYKCDST